MATDGAALAAELAARVDAEARLATALVELERHPGHLTLAAGTCTGVTGERWTAAIDPVVARCAALAAVRDGWAAELVDLEAALAAADAVRAEADEAGHRAQELIAGVDPLAPDPLPPLRARIATLPRISGWPARTTAVQDLWTDVANTTAAPRTAAAAAAGLVDRRGELRGRFDAYRAKATRLGVAERPDVLAAGDRVRDLLWTRPCDLAAATVAVVAYQRLIRDGGWRS